MGKAKSSDLAVQKSAIVGRFARDYVFSLQWMPQYIEEFPKAIEKVPQPLKWEHRKFVSAAQSQIPDKHGVYCFTIELGDPFPPKIHLPLYIGKAPNQFLSERFKDYLSEKTKVSGREKVVVMLNKYHDKLLFWWAELPRVYVDVVEEHLIMCCKPPCNDKTYDRERFWAKAFE